MKLKKNKNNNASTKKKSSAKKKSSKADNSKQDNKYESFSTSTNSEKPVITDFINADTVKIDNEEQLSKALSHVYHHDVYDTLGMLDELGAILVDDEDLKAIHQARELFTAIKYIKENLVAE